MWVKVKAGYISIARPFMVTFVQDGPRGD